MKENSLNKIKVNIQGMHCPSCEVLIERNFKKIKGVEKVRVNHVNGRAELQCSQEPSIEDLNKAIKDQGYTVSSIEKNSSSRYYEIKKDHLEIGAIFVIVIGLYLSLRHFNLIPTGLAVSDNMSYGFVFLIGLVAAFSTCMAVTGGLLLSVTTKYNESNPSLTNTQKFKQHIYFNLGRIISYTIFGGLLGLLGSVFLLSPKITGVLTIVVSLIMILLGLQILNIFPWIRYFQPKMPKFIAHKILNASGKNKKTAPFLFGSSTFFLPCGFTQALQLYVLATGSFKIGALTMLAFSLGTLPSLISLGALSSFTKGIFHKYFTKVSAVVVILLGALSLVNGFALTGNVIGIDTTSQKDNPLVNLVDGKQVINMAVNGLEYYPSTFTIVKGIPVEWKIDGTKAQGCARVITVPNLGITEYLSATGVKTIEFTAKETGTIRFSCSMGMAGPGTFVVVENENPNQEIKQKSLENKPVNGEVQKLSMEISKERGFYPNTFTVKKDIPVELEIDAKVQLSGCMGVMVIPDYDIAHSLIIGKSTIKFTPNKEGKSIFTCSMGTPLGSFLVE